jgi:hypothetical protein
MLTRTRASVSDGFFRALPCRPHRCGIFGRDRRRDLDEGALSNDGASTDAVALHAAIGIDRLFTAV